MFIKSVIFSLAAASTVFSAPDATEDASCRFKSPILATTVSAVDNTIASCAPNCYTLDDAKNHLTTSGIIYKNAAKTSISCIDARNYKNIIASPGGDAAEFIQGVAHWFNQTGTTKPADELTWMVNKLKAFLNEHITTTRPFYFHTGQKYLDNAFARMQVNAFPKYAPTGADLTNWLNELSKWDAQGCGHLRYMIKDPLDYNVPDWISVNGIKAIWTLYWDKTYSSKILIENYFAALTPQNVFLIQHKTGTGYTSSDSCFTQLPAIKGTINPARLIQTSSFVYHIEYVDYYRKTKITPFFFNQAGDDVAGQGTKLVNQAMAQFLVSAGHLAAGLPIVGLELEKLV